MRYWSLLMVDVKLWSEYELAVLGIILTVSGAVG